MRAQCKRIVRVALLVGILLGSDANLFATGSRENPSDASRFVPFYSNRAAPRDVRYSIHVTGRAGATVIELALDFSTIDYVLVKETSAYVEAAQTEAQKATNYWGSSVPAAARTILDNNTLQEFPLISSTAFSSTVHATFAPGSTNLGTIPAEYYVRGTKICEIPITSYGDDSIVRVLLIHRDGSWERIGLQIEFFQGEKELFATAGSLPYYKKALGFQYSLFAASGEEVAFKSAAIKYVTDIGLGLTEDDPCWVAFQGANGLSEHQQTFRSVFARHFAIGKTGSVSYVRSGAESFDQIYGKRRSLYMAAYLRFLFERGKPILSKVLNSEMKRLDSGFTYDWKQYEKIPSGPGQDGERLAEAALRYLTWGVEYQLAGEKPDAARNEVFKNNRAIIDEWVSTGSSDGRRNYLPASVNIGHAIPLSPEETAVTALLKTPFGVSRGNPLPYARQGIDSPRTFAYKMWEQWRVRDWSRRNGMDVLWDMKETFLSTFGSERIVDWGYTEETALLPFTGRNAHLVTIAENRFYNPYFEGEPPKAGAKGITSPYASGDEILKPFLPGGAQRFIRPGAENEQPGPYNTDKIAGVDSVGLLSGSLAMATYLAETERLALRVKGLENQAPAENLQAYYRMQTPVAGLDDNGKPIFYALPGSPSSLLSGGYRFRRGDLERATVLVPDVADMRAGDLLVGDDLEEGFRFGIVVGFLEDPPAQVGMNLDQFMSKVLVLSVDRNARRVYLSRWAGGKFTTTPKAFQLRRLLRLKLDGSMTAGYSNDSWELVDTVTTKLSVSIAYEADNTPNGMPRWIPNTGEMLVIHKITIRKENAWGVGEAFTSDKDTFLLPLPPLDYGVGPAEPAEGSNIYTNHGGSIGLYALGKSQQQVIASFAKLPGSDEYQCIGGPLKDGTLTSQFRLVVVDSVLTFQGPGINTTRFGLRAIDDVRPGDDYLLRFGLYDKASPSAANSLLASGTIPDSQAPAVYDKKLLWRANLYIDEGANDWNNVNPWNAPPGYTVAAAMRANGTLPKWWSDESGYNEWNRKWQPSTTAIPNAYTFNDLLDLPVGDGRQVVRNYPSWVRYTDGLSGNQEGKTTVPYTWGGTDDPFDFIWKMRQSGLHQAEALWLRSEAAKAVPSQVSPPAIAPDLSNYPTTPPSLAPAGAALPGGAGVAVNAWYRYVFANGTFSNGNYVYDNAAVSFQVKGQTYQTYPYVPNLSIYHFTRIPETYDAPQVLKSSGIDCSGFIQVSASYIGNTYDVSQHSEGQFRDGAAGRDSWNSVGDSHLKFATTGIISRSYLIAENNEQGLAALGNRLVPGDILIAALNHVAIVSSVNDANGNGMIEANEISLIEAAAGPWNEQGAVGRLIYAVMNSQKADKTNYQGFSFMRLSVR